MVNMFDKLPGMAIPERKSKNQREFDEAKLRDAKWRKSRQGRPTAMNVAMNVGELPNRSRRVDTRQVRTCRCGRDRIARTVQAV